ncbi:hypothetical protein [Nitrosospira sp. Nsp1]|uniref:hypothetical protein n=1 Tax=Nitrosospira sp. Nsp1 TaxID=136547 RepID=UPI0008875710|nr:hypothetical protein [Nitrosospira sp. Nsp1]SCX51045.1 hypothetical protein SAMN05720354_11021 [Nitrosospira sp. Nsp1]
MIEREVKLLLDVNAVKQVQVHYAVMSDGYMVVIDGNPLETGRRETRQFKTLDAAAKLLFKIGIANFSVKLKTS